MSREKPEQDVLLHPPPTGLLGRETYKRKNGTTLKAIPTQKPQ
jgi:hypothetical protein